MRLVLALPRRRAFGAVLAASTCTTYGDAIELGTLHFYSIRIVIMFALVRIIVRSELRASGSRPSMACSSRG